MRIIAFSTLYPPPYYGGAERSTQEMLQDLAAAGHDVEAVALSRLGGSASRDGAVRVRRVRNRNPIWRWPRTGSALHSAVWYAFDVIPVLGLIRAIRLLRTAEPDLVLSNNISGWSYTPWIAATVLRIPVVHVIRDYYLICARGSRFRNGRNCERTCGSCVPRVAASKAYARPRQVVAVSAAVGTIHAAAGLFADHRIAVCWPEVDRGGTDTRTVSVARPAERELQVAFIGRLSPEKGVERLLEACDGLPVQVTVYGTGADAYLSRLAARFPHAKFAGHVDVAEALAATDLLVVPSLWREPFGRIAAEGALHGIPVVVPPYGGLREAVESVGGRYAVVDPANTAALRDLILRASEREAVFTIAEPVPRVPIAAILAERAGEKR